MAQRHNRHGRILLKLRSVQSVCRHSSAFNSLGDVNATDTAALVASSFPFKAKSIQLAPISLLNETGNLTSEDANVFSFPLFRLPVLPYVVADLLAIGQGSTEAYSRDVDEHIRSTIIRSDEAKPLILSEEFYGASCHLYPL